MKCLKFLFYFVVISLYGGFSYCSEDKTNSVLLSDQKGDGSVVDQILMDLLPKNVDYKYQFHTNLFDGDALFNSDLRRKRSKEPIDLQTEGMSSKQTPLTLSAVRNLNLDGLMDGSNLLLMNEINGLKEDLNGAKKSLNGMSKNLNYDVGLNIGNRASIRSSLIPESRSARRRKSKPEDDAKTTNTTDETPKKIPNQRRLMQTRDKKKSNETIPVVDLKPSKQASKKVMSSNGISSTAMPGDTSISVTKSASSKSLSTVAQSQMQSDSPSTHVATLKGNLAERTLTHTTNSVNSPVEHSTSIKDEPPFKAVTTAISSVHESGSSVPTKTSHADEKTTPSTTTTGKKEISTRPTETTTMKPTSPALKTTERPHITSPHTTPSSTVRNTSRSTTQQVTTVTSAHITSTPASITTTTPTTTNPSSKSTSTPKAKSRKSSALSIKPLLLAIITLPILNLLFSV